MTERTEEIYVLYGSQTGNSEQAALDLCNQVEKRLSPAVIQKVTGTKERVTVVPKHLQLDDFLELERCQWTRLVVIIVSSYGVGQAPLGSYRFRELCDAWLDDENSKETDDENSQTLDGVYFAMCGLGDSKYTTFFRNPTTINDGLTSVGAKRVGALGKADASGTGKDAQLQVIERWMEGIWTDLARVVALDPLPEDKLKDMQAQTIAVCRKINPDFAPETSEPGTRTVVSLVVALVAMVVGYFAVKASLTHPDSRPLY